MSFKITIINNEDGEVLVNEENAVAIIGAVTTEEHTACLGYTSCNAMELANAVRGADNAKDSILKKSPMVKLLCELGELAKNED